MLFFAPNGAIVLEQTGNTYRVSPKDGVPPVEVDVGVTINNHWLVTVSPTWLHTDEERFEVVNLAVEAVRGYREWMREGVLN